jgi:hypothetical protein
MKQTTLSENDLQPDLKEFLSFYKKMELAAVYTESLTTIFNYLNLIYSFTSHISEIHTNKTLIF